MKKLMKKRTLVQYEGIRRDGALDSDELPAADAPPLDSKAKREAYKARRGTTATMGSAQPKIR